MKLERQWVTSALLFITKGSGTLSKTQLSAFLRGAVGGLSSRPPLSLLCLLCGTCPVLLSAVSHWACCSEMTQLLVRMVLWQWFFPSSKSTSAILIFVIPEGKKKKKVNIGVLFFNLNPCALATKAEVLTLVFLSSKQRHFDGESNFFFDSGLVQKWNVTVLGQFQQNLPDIFC